MSQRVTLLCIIIIFVCFWWFLYIWRKTCWSTRTRKLCSSFLFVNIFISIGRGDDIRNIFVGGRAMHQLGLDEIKSVTHNLRLLLLWISAASYYNITVIVSFVYNGKNDLSCISVCALKLEPIKVIKTPSVWAIMWKSFQNVIKAEAFIL